MGGCLLHRAVGADDQGRQVAAAGQPQVHSLVAAAHGGQDEGREAGLVGGQEGPVEEAEDPLVVVGERQQGLQGVADLAGQHRRVQSLARDVTEDDEGLPGGVGSGVDVVEVTADAFLVRGGAVVPGVLHAVDAAEFRREQFPHEGGGDGGLLGVEAGRGERGAGPGGEQAGECLLALGERLLGAGAQQHEGSGGHSVAGQRGDDDGADRAGEALGDEPVGDVVGVEPAGRDRREALQGLGEARNGAGVDLLGDLDGPRAPCGVRELVAASLGRGDQDGALGEVLGGQGGGHLHAARHVQRRQEGGGDPREHLGPCPGAVQRRLRLQGVGAVDQPPDHSPVAGGGRVRLEEPVAEVSGRDVAAAGAPCFRQAVVGLGQPGGREVAQPVPRAARGRYRRAASLSPVRTPRRSATSTG